MQALINLTPIYGNSLNKAIFADGGLAFDNQTTLTGNSGPDADVYTNKHFTCENNQNFAGSVYAQGDLTIGNGCTIGHRAMLHGCTIGANSLVGMGAIILNGARIGASSLVGAGALVTEGKEFPARSLIVGSPAKAIRTLDDAAIERLRLSAAHYVENGRRFRLGLGPADAQQ